MNVTKLNQTKAHPSLQNPKGGNLDTRPETSTHKFSGLGPQPEAVFCKHRIYHTKTGKNIFMKSDIVMIRQAKVYFYPATFPFK
jgi:hypothetical protein